MTIQKHILVRVGKFAIVLLLLALGIYIKSFFTHDGTEIIQFVVLGFIWIFLSALYLLLERSNLKDKNKRKFNLIIGYSLFLVLILLTLQFIRGATYAF